MKSNISTLFSKQSKFPRKLKKAIRQCQFQRFQARPLLIEFTHPLTKWGRKANQILIDEIIKALDNLDRNVRSSFFDVKLPTELPTAADMTAIVNKDLVEGNENPNVVTSPHDKPSYGDALVFDDISEDINKENERMLHGSCIYAIDAKNIRK